MTGHYYWWHNHIVTADIDPHFSNYSYYQYYYYNHEYIADVRPFWTILNNFEPFWTILDQMFNTT
jgi:hypothetical protein